ncbi:MAG: acyl-CoA dehydrogenase family protein [Pseudomonadales bacterium]|nr:acyl-CoA dehydrogenase family protein [Pseudomonadales bacterium]
MFDSLVLADLPPEAEALRGTVKALVQETLATLTLEQRARSWAGFDATFSRAMAAAGLIGLTLPREYGGQGRGPFARFVVVEELLTVGAPVAAHWIADRQSAPLLLRYGSETQRRYYLPRICRGEIYFCIGMSEPGAGSDLASVRTRAVATESGWRLSGQKVWTTYAHRDDFMIALVRTSEQSSDRREGLSQFIVDLRAPGVNVRPIEDLAGDRHFSEVYFDDVVLPAEALVGAEGQGWEQCIAELAFERSGPERIYSSSVLLDAWIAHLRGVGRRDEATRALVGQLASQLAVLREMSIGCTALLERGMSPVVEASIVKDLGTAFEQSIPALIADDLGAHPGEPVAPELVRTLHYLSQLSPAFSLRGGTREILRGIIARGMGLR